MTSLKSDFLRISQERGFIHQCTDLDQLDKRLCEKPIVAYIGFDATADSLHVGSLVQIMWLRWLQKTGHKPLVLMGGGTTKIGDPSDKDTMRKLLSEKDIAQNITHISTIFEKFLTFGEGETDALLLNNDDWLSGLEYIPFLREIGRHFTINRMLTFENVKRRLDREQPLTFLEFNYMILQAYDYYELNKTYGCELQMGGSDQWGNILNGTELIRRLAGKDSFGLTVPLITTADGAKMGKTADGAIWLREDKLPVFDFWQFWRNTQDADVGRFLRLFTELPLEEINRLESLQGSEINEAKKILADEVTRLTHGDEAVVKARETAKTVFESGGGTMGGTELPRVQIPKAELVTGIPGYEILKRAGLAASNGDARRLIRGGGGRLNDVPFTGEDQLVTLKDQTREGIIKLSAGKKRHALVVVE